MVPALRETVGLTTQIANVLLSRLCRDAVSPNQDFIIDYHPKCANLVIASAGSFHSWKFLPNIGEYVVKRIFNTLDEDLVRKWAWDRENTGSACEMYDPTRDMKSIGDFKGWPKTAGAGGGTTSWEKRLEGIYLFVRNQLRWSRG